MRSQLGTTDAGVAMLRGLLRSQIRMLAQGTAPLKPDLNTEGRIPTYTGDFVVKVPLLVGQEELQQREFGRKLASILVDTLSFGFNERQAEVKRRLLSSG